jgi:DNA modification methylase
LSCVLFYLFDNPWTYDAWTGDCFDLLGSIPDGAVDLVLFSPPYDGIRSYGGGWQIDLPRLSRDLHRVTAEGGIAAVVIGDSSRNHAKSLTSFRLAVDWCDNAGWRLWETCIYHRPGNPGAWWNTRFRVDHEYIHLFLKGARPKTFDKATLMIPSKHAGKTWSGTDRTTAGSLRRIESSVVAPTKCRGTVWPYASSNTEGNRLKLQHPATFPDRLAEDVIRAFTKEGELVLDPMAGSGTTCVAATRLGRRSLGIDINPEYVAIAEERLRREVAKPDEGSAPI